MKTAAIYHPDNNYLDILLNKFQAALPDHQVTAWAEQQAADYLITWQPQAKLYATPNLKVIFGLGAGVDVFLSANIPPQIKIVRLQEAGMSRQMLEIALYAILHHSRDMIALNKAQKQQQWLNISTPKRPPFSTKVGVMGLGQLGEPVAKGLAQLGYPVSGYSRSPKQISDIQCFHGQQFDQFLANSEVLINLLPLTPHTENILNQNTFAKLPQGAYLINLARGKHLIEADLTAALDSGQLAGALLDVFRQEPPAKDHPFWLDNRITITPHLAAITIQEQAVQQVSRNIKAFEQGQPMTGLVDRAKGY